MQDPDELERRLKKFRPSEAAPAQDTQDAPDAQPTKAEQPTPEGQHWVVIGDGIGRILVDDPPKFQPENDHPAEDPKQFRPWRRVGKEPYDESFFALPYPRWPRPGALMSREVSDEHFAALMLYIDANGYLRRYFDWLRGPKRYLGGLPPATEGEPHYLIYDRQRYHDAAAIAAQNLSWLMGVWRTKEIPLPTVEELERLETVRKD